MRYKRSPHLGYMLQPAAQSDEDEEHGRRVEEGDGAVLSSLGHGHQEHDAGVCVRCGGGQHNQHIHVGYPVSQGFVGLDVEVAPPKDLKDSEKNKGGCLKKTQ